MPSSRHVATKSRLSLAEMRVQAKENDGYIKGVLRLSFRQCVGLGEEDLLDQISDGLTGSDLLMDINYKVLAVDDDGNTLVIEASGDVSEVLDNAE